MLLLWKIYIFIQNGGLKMYNNLDIYFKNIEYNNMIYSIDKIRLKTYINFQQFNDLENYINIYFKENIKNFWLSDKKGAFHYNYNIEIEEGKSFIFQFMHNNESISYNDIEKVYNFTIEFNPNKLRDNFLLIHILNSFCNWLLRGFDLAIDIPINILDLVIDKNRKRKFFMQSYGGDNVTYYLGTKEKDGSVKIYNKKVESDLPIVGHLTRIEISRKYDDYDIKGIKNYEFGEQFLPILYLNQYLATFSDVIGKDKTLLGLLYAVQHGYSINNLSRVYKEKIKNMLEGSSRIQFSNKIARSSFKAMFVSIFYQTRL